MSVAFTSVDGSVVIMVHKHKKRKYNNEDDRDVSCMALMERLRDANVKPTTANLLRCGIGARTLYLFKRNSNLLKFKRRSSESCVVK